MAPSRRELPLPVPFGRRRLSWPRFSPAPIALRRSWSSSRSSASWSTSASWRAEALAAKLQKAGGRAEVVRQRHWTAFYFQQALGFELQRRAGFPYFTIAPNNPFLWECLRNSLLLALVTPATTTLVCLPLAYFLTRYRFAGRAALASLLLVPLIIPPFVGAVG